jgi:hypothetical protein
MPTITNPNSLSNSYRQYKSTLNADNVHSYPSENLMDEWRYTNYVQFDAFDYGTNTRALNSIIILPLPEDLQIAIQPSWTQEATPAGMLTGAAQAGLQTVIDNMKGRSQAIAQTLSSGASFAFNMYGAKNGVLLNPMQQQLFKFVNFRTISLHWTLSPKSADDSASIQKIIQMMKWYSLPSLGAAGGMVMNYPSEFDIKFLFNYQVSQAAKGVASDTGNTSIKTNQSLFSLDRCVITNISVNYSPTGAYSNFYTGAPTEVGLQIDFSEIYMLNRDKYVDMVNANGVGP